MAADTTGTPGNQELSLSATLLGAQPWIEYLTFDLEKKRFPFINSQNKAAPDEVK